MGMLIDTSLKMLLHMKKRRIMIIIGKIIMVNKFKGELICFLQSRCPAF